MNDLLYEVRKDAFVKARGIEPDERFFDMVYHMNLLARTAGKDGMLSLEEAAQKLPPEICFYRDIQKAVLQVCDGMDADDLAEILTARYWVKNLKNEDALLYYMLILSVLRIQDGASPYLVECLLTACLSDNDIIKYAEYKKQRPLPQPEQTAVERLLNHNPDCESGGIVVVKRLLEDKIEQADEKTIKSVIRAGKESDFLVSIKGLSIPAKEKLFSVMLQHKVEEYAVQCEYLGPVRQIDAMAAMAELVAVFEKQQNGGGHD